MRGFLHFHSLRLCYSWWRSNFPPQRLLEYCRICWSTFWPILSNFSTMKTELDYFSSDQTPISGNTWVVSTSAISVVVSVQYLRHCTKPGLEFLVVVFLLNLSGLFSSRVGLTAFTEPFHIAVSFHQTGLTSCVKQVPEPSGWPIKALYTRRGQKVCISSQDKLLKTCFGSQWTYKQALLTPVLAVL